MGVYGDPKKKVRGPSNAIFVLVLLILIALFIGCVSYVGMLFYPLIFER